MPTSSLSLLQPPKVQAGPIDWQSLTGTEPPPLIICVLTREATRDLLNLS